VRPGSPRRVRRLASYGLLLAVAAVCPLVASPDPGARTVVYLVRHGEKAQEPRRDPGLTPAGQERAAALRDALARARLNGVVTTQFRRTRATAAPLAAALGLEPHVIRYRPGDFDAHGAAVAAAIRERFAGGSVLVVGHSDTVPAIVRALGGPEIERLCEPTEYAALFTLVTDGDAPTSLVRTSYGSPDPPLPPECRSARP